MPTRTARESRRRIDAIRRLSTGEIAPAHEIGQTKTGKRVIAGSNNWEPVARMADGSYRPSAGVTLDRDFNWVEPRQ